MIYSINMNYCTCMYMYMYSSYKMYNSICIIYMYYSIHCMYVNVLHVHVCTCMYMLLYYTWYMYTYMYYNQQAL